MTQIKVTPQQVMEGQRALDTAALNGVVFLAMTLRRRHLLSDEETELMHAAISKPLNLDRNAANPVAQAAQQQLDEQFATILEQRPPS